MPKQSQDQLSNIRHSLAHLLASSVLEMFPKAKLGVGPVIENGFYYDFLLPRAVTPEELNKLEKRMRDLARQKLGFEAEELFTSEAKKFFKEKDQDFKLELISDIEKFGTTSLEEIEQAPQTPKEGLKTVTLYKTGKFTDLCRGGHVKNTSEIPLDAFKLDRVAGAYWRGKETNPQLTRIYGLAFNTKKELDTYIETVNEAKKRDHKKIGVQLDLFTFSDLVGPGLPLWTPKGTLVRDLLNDYIWSLRKEVGFSKVEIPHITKKELYQTSGHWDKFKDELFRIKTREGHEFAMKPMNCPHHTQIYAHSPKSYRDLPQRYANTTMVYRDEQSGELSGLTRVRSITQDDAHIFARHSQVGKELGSLWNVIMQFYKAFGFKEFEIRLSFSDPKNMEKYLGDKATWKQAESTLENFVKSKKAKYTIALGEAAFYGPKIDFIAKDWASRPFQVATIQLDYNMPERFDLTCVNEQGEKERIVMMHCAVMGSIERAMAMLIEHFAGWFPLWLAPVQVKVLPISKAQNKYANLAVKELLKQIPDLRIEIDDSNESIGKKIREASMQKIPYLLIAGEKEVKAKKLSVRKKDKDLGSLAIKKLAESLKKEISTKAIK